MKLATSKCELVSTARPVPSAQLLGLTICTSASRTVRSERVEIDIQKLQIIVCHVGAKITIPTVQPDWVNHAYGLVSCDIAPKVKNKNLLERI